MTALIHILTLLASATIDLTGVEIYSTSSVRYGRWDIRMKAAAAPGTVSSFFTYYPNSYLDSPYPWREIDIEVLGKNGKAFQSNLITGTAGNKTTSEDLHTFSSDLSQTYHTYTLDWTPDSVVWRLDGALVRKTTSSDQQVKDLADSAQTFRMNLWGSKSSAWAGTLDVNNLPVLQIVHWMRFSNYTPHSGTGGSNFTVAWVDSFKTIDKSRWALGNWTFDGNYATFAASNAKVKDGHLLMMLSTSATSGDFPATFPHDTAGATRIDPNGRPSSPAPRFLGGTRWLLPEASQAELVDVRGAKVGSTRATPSGVEIDLAGVRGVALVRAGGTDWRLLAP